MVVSYRWTSGYGGPCYLFHVSFNPNPNPIDAQQHTSDSLDLGDTVAVTEDNTDLRGRSTLSGELADVVDNLVGSDLNPGSGGARVRESRRGNTLSLGVKTTHFEC